MSSDGSFPALGDRFIAFRLVLASKSVPPISTLFDFWDELRSHGFDWLISKQFRHDEPPFSPKHATHLLITGIAHDRTRKGGATPGIDTAIRFIDGRWKLVRDELVKFAAILVEEQGKVKAAEARLHQAEPPPDGDEKEGPPSDRQHNILDAMLEREAFDSESRLSTDEIAEKVEGRHANSESFKHPIADLKRRGLIDTKRGRNGGCWLTKSGREFTERRNNA